MPVSQDFNVAFQELQPDLILSSVESLGYQTDGRLLALNSYENRVYRVGLEDEAPLVAKFYRPGNFRFAVYPCRGGRAPVSPIGL